MSAMRDFTIPDYAKLERRRINANPKRSLAVFRSMKAAWPYFTPSRSELASRLLSLRLLGDMG